VPYDSQLARKGARVAAALAGYPELAGLSVPDVEPAQPAFGYRTRAKLVAEPGRGLGLYARGGHSLLDLPGCGALVPELAALVEQVRGWVHAGLPIAGLDAAHTGAALLVTFIAAPGERARVHTALAAHLDELAPHVHVALSERAPGPQLLGRDHAIVRGQAELRARLTEGGPYHYATHGGFLQAHQGVARTLYTRLRAAVRTATAERPRVLELYAGAGALALALAHDGCDVLAVEAFAPAAERIGRAAREQSLAVRVEAGDAAELAARLADAGERFDAVLVNPPRRGLDVAVRRALARLRPALLAYVSCGPETLARDLAHLARLRLVAQRVQPFDMIPQTEHVECLALLAPGAPPAHARVALEDGRVLTWRSWDAPAHACAFAPPRWASGAALEGDSAPPASVTLLVLARGITHKAGRLGAGLRYTCTERVGGHSLLRVEAAPEALAQLPAQLARLGHPLVGDERDRATARHFAMRHGLDRPFAHVYACAMERGAVGEFDAPLRHAPDLAAVLSSLRGARAEAGDEP
jgi:23S rRNA (uracil1939-C5)-methyltransferase